MCSASCDFAWLMLSATLLPRRVSVERGGLCRWPVGKLLWPWGSAQPVSLKLAPRWEAWWGKPRHFLLTEECFAWLRTHTPVTILHQSTLWTLSLPDSFPCFIVETISVKNSSLKVILYHRATEYCASYFVFCLVLNYLVLKYVCEALCHGIRRHLLL